MSIITRDDKEQFVVQPYRELLSLRTASLLKKEIRLLAQQNGAFVRLFKQPNGRFEAVFSRDPGYLMAEMIWNHLGKPADMIYCEALADEKNAIVVIVRAGMVLFDARLPITTLAEELSALLALKNKFHIYTYGAIPISREPNADNIVLDDDQILSFTQLDLPLFPNIAVDKSFELLPLDQAITEQRIGTSSATVTLVMLLAVLGVGIGIWNYKQANTTAAVPTEQQDPYQGYRVALLNPPPSEELTELSSAITESYGMPGWVTTSLTYQNGVASLQVHSLGGTVDSLMNWASANNAEVSLQPGGAVVLFNANLPNRTTPTAITQVDPVIARVIDNLMPVLPGNSVQINEVNSQGVYTAVSISINFSSIAPNVLPLIGNAIQGLPLRLDSTNAQMQGGLLSGSIKLTALGN